MTGVRTTLAVLLIAGAAAAGPRELWDQARRASFRFEETAIADIARAVCVRFGHEPPSVGTGGERKVDFKARNVTLLGALSRLAEENGMIVRGWPGRPKESRYANQDALHLERRWRPSYRSTPAPVGPTTLVANHARFDEDALDVSFRWIVPQELGRIAIVEVVLDPVSDDKGAEWRHPAARFRPAGANDWFTVALLGGSHEATRIPKITGTLQVALPVKHAEISFGGFYKNKTKVLGAGKVTFHEF